MENEILNFLQDEISDDEIEIAKERLCGQEILGETHTSFLLQRIWNFYSMGFPVMETDEILFAVRSVKKSDIIALIKNLLTEKRASIVFAPNLPHKIKRKILCKTKSK
jgi:predicted Zn-dependent peptidase